MRDDLYNWWVNNGEPAQFPAENLYKEQGKPLGHIPREEFRAYIREFRLDPELVKSNVAYKLQTQKYQDTNRIERKTFREHARISNAVEEYTKELISVFNKHDVAKFTIKHDVNGKAVGLVHITDAHFNELVELDNNKYDFKIAGQRLKLLISKARQYFKGAGITNVLIALTGDLINSDRRLDELLNQATNRSKATFLAVQLLENVIIDLNQDFNITVACVSGNESRVGKDWSWSEQIASDNYDFTIFNILKYIFKNSESISFISGDSVELVVNLAGQKVLMLHGNSITADTEKSVQQIIGKYSTKGIRIDYVIFGHLHSARVGDNYARGSSLVGSNAYSDRGLQLSGRASQNIGLFFDNGNRDVIKVDLQNYQGVEGYDIEQELEAYNAKSASKLHQKQTIFEVVV